MIRPSLIDRYVFKEILVSCGFSFAVFMVAGLVAGFLPLLQKGMEAGLHLTIILFQVLITALPGTLVTVLPLSMTIGILLGLGRLASDNEIMALKSSGVSVVRLVPPVFVLGLLGVLLSLVCTLVLIPRGIDQGRRLIQRAATTRADVGLEERTFFDKIQNLIIYVDRIDSATATLHRLFIRESSEPDEVKTILAQRGKIASDPETKALILHLRNGTILKEDKNGDSAGSLAFESYVFRFSLEKALAEAETPSLEELSLSQIQVRIEEVTQKENSDSPEIRAFCRRVKIFARILVTQRFIHPLACLALALMAFPLGIVNLAKSRLNNVALGLAVIFVYYALSLATERIARSGLAPPELVLPLPAVLFIAASVYFTRCVQQERVPVLMRCFHRITHRGEPR